MPGAEDVPGSDKRRSHSAGANQRFAFRAHGDEVAHHRGRLRYAEINEMPNAGLARGFHCDLDGWKIDAPKLGRLSRTRVRDPDQMDERLASADSIGVGTLFQRIAE